MVVILASSYLPFSPKNICSFHDIHIEIFMSLCNLYFFSNTVVFNDSRIITDIVVRLIVHSMKVSVDYIVAWWLFQSHTCFYTKTGVKLLVIKHLCFYSSLQLFFPPLFIWLLSFLHLFLLPYCHIFTVVLSVCVYAFVEKWSKILWSCTVSWLLTFVRHQCPA